MKALFGLLLTGWAFAKPIVVTETLKATEISDLITYPARTIPRVNASVLSETDGIVTHIEATLGSQIKKDDTVLIVQNTDPVYRYAPAEVQAPVSGVVGSADVTIGSRVSKGQKLLQITDPTRVQAVIEIAVNDLPAITKGLKGEFFLEGIEKPVEVEVVGISPLVDPALGTATGELKFLPKELPLIRPGVVGKILFKLRTRIGIQIPESAIAYQGRVPNARVLASGKVTLVPISLGPTIRGNVEVLSGLKAGMVLVLRASSFVAEGDEVTVQPSQKSAGE